MEAVLAILSIRCNKLRPAGGGGANGPALNTTEEEAETVVAEEEDGAVLDVNKDVVLCTGGEQKTHFNHLMKTKMKV